MSTPTDNDRELLEQWTSGDGAAGEALFERHFDSVYGFFSRKISGDVSDLVQRTFLGLSEGRDRLSRDASVRAYVFGIARNVLYGEYRARQKNDQLSFEAVSLHDLDPTPTEEIAKREQSRLLLEALRHIPLDLQIAVELHYWEELPGPDIALVLGIPEGTVRSRLRRALAALRAVVARLGEGEPALDSTLTNLEGWSAQLAELARD